jgi:hypothetical protein
VTKSRVDTLLEAVDRLSILSDEIFLEMDNQLGKIAVWGVHNSKLDQAILLAADRGRHWSYDELYAWAALYRLLWQLDAPRTERSTCVLCRDTLPRQEEYLCRCFREIEIGRKIDCSLHGLERLQVAFPQNWADVQAEVYQCKNPACKEIAEVNAGVVFSKVKQGVAWVTPKLCHRCYKNRAYSKPSTVPPPRTQVRTPVIPKNSPVPSMGVSHNKQQTSKPNDLTDNQLRAISVGLPTAES